MRLHLRLAALLLSLSAASAAMAHAAPPRYPSKPVTLVVPAATGGPTDVIARMLAERLTSALGEPVVVENRPGATQMLGTSMVAKSNADGYTLLFAPSTPLIVLPFTTKNVPYDVLRDFAMVSHIGSTPLVLYAHADVPAGSIKEMVALAKAKPGALSYSTWGNGSSGHLLVELMSKQVGIKLIHVGYRGMGPSVADLAGGQVPFGMGDVGVPAPYVKSGRVKPLAVAGSTRAPALPDVPTFAQQGITGMETFSPWFAVLAPAATPRPVVDRLATEITRIVKTPEFTRRLTEFGVTPTGLNAAESTELVQKEFALWRKIIQEDLSDIKFE